MRQFLDKLKRYFAQVLSITGVIGQIISLIGFFSTLSKKEAFGFLTFFRDNYILLWLISLTLIVIAGSYWILLMNRRFIFGFSDSFSKNPKLNWDFRGSWTIADDNILVITGADEGGITKKGADWENYTISFKAKIVNGRLGVIVRANDLNDYYMLQINPNVIVPHQRISIPKIIPNSIDPLLGNKIEMQIGWKVYDNLVSHLSKELVDWFDVRIKVKDQSVSMFINNRMEFEQDSFLQISKGKIGFRCHGEEKALIKKVKIILNP